MGFFALILNFSLVGAAGFAAFIIKLEHPYAFMGCAFAFIHALFSIIHAMHGAEESKVKDISDSIMEIAPLSLINIELYMGSESKAFADAHWFFVLPLTFDLIARLFTEEGVDSSVQTLKDITILGNTVSLAYLAFAEGKYIFAVLAALVLIGKYGSFLSANIRQCAEAVFYILLALSLGGGGGEGGEEEPLIVL